MVTERREQYLRNFLQNLLDGINPITGEELDNKSSWKSKEIMDDVKSLYISEDENKINDVTNLKEKKTKSLAEKRKKWPNSHKRWTDEEEGKLKDLFLSKEISDHNKIIKNISNSLKRSEYAIFIRLKKMDFLRFCDDCEKVFISYKRKTDICFNCQKQKDKKSDYKKGRRMDNSGIAGPDDQYHRTGALPEDFG